MQAMTNQGEILLCVHHVLPTVSECFDDALILNTSLINFLLVQIAPAASQCLQRLAAKLLDVCKNPTQPGFNHYLFESTAALIRCSAASDPNMVPALEQQLFPAFNIVLQEDVQVTCKQSIYTYCRQRCLLYVWI